MEGDIDESEFDLFSPLTEEEKKIAALLQKTSCEKKQNIRDSILKIPSHDRQQCAKILDVVEKTEQWEMSRHSAHTTTDIPCKNIPEIDDFVRGDLRENLLPHISEFSGFKPDHFKFSDLFFVKYEAKQGAQSGLNIHSDGSIISFNILLNNEQEFTGGGTYFKHTDTTVKITQGDCVVHDGKLNHAGACITSGRRMLLVGFLQV